MEHGTDHFWRWRREGAAGGAGKQPGEESLDSLMQRVAVLRDTLRGTEPAAIASRTGAVVHSLEPGNAELRLAVWGRPVSVRVPAFISYDPSTGKESDPGTQALLIYYLATSDGIPEAGRWVSFSELPDGRFYQKAFQGYTGDLLVRTFGNDQAALARAAERAGGMREALGDLAYSFRPLPRIRLALVYWCGDEEFPPSAKMLFDVAAPRHLPTDVCAILGASLVRRLIRARKMEEDENR
jgi:hypothetical protein